MSKWAWVGIGALVAAVAALAWRSGIRDGSTPVAQSEAPRQSGAKTTAPNAPSDRATSPAAAAKPPPGEPPEDVLLRFLKEEYDEINRAGGMKAVVSATGREILLKPKLYSGRKDSCRPVAREPEGSYECGLSLMVTLREGDNKPGQHAERQFVHWDAVAGEWKRGLANDRQRKSAR